MPELTRPQLAVYAVAAVALALLGARYLRSTSAPQPVAASHTAPSSGSSGSSGGPSAGVDVSGAGGGIATVQVAGAVRRPGVYRVRASGRVDDAVRKAGGPTRRADLTGVNLAAKLQDGRQVIVPERDGSVGAGSAPSGGAVPGAPGTAPPRPISLNTATAEQLDALDGVGPTMAQKIVVYRQQHGGFGSVDELDQIPGVGPKRLATLRPLVHV